ncbi:hypothetical protein HG536_0B06270 [Torulaspora globosa]|uniref:Ubiquitin-like protease family profile domain-containing protein n=1 Tax=Torulaspora globosa TaxID=48254 RepID=A0A7G3ZE24_9SACH|nr:uncharacterized protein HG536_0B06270 [Torulaspora globosa]QLL31760.1 hypothetical protein HG536_0B06270 [Torulaspora globosa]
MSVDAYRRLKTDNYYTPLFSTISTFRSTNVPIFSSKRNMSRASEQLPRRCFSANDVDLSLKGTQSAGGVRQEGLLKGISSSFFEGGKSVWRKLAGSRHSIFEKAEESRNESFIKRSGTAVKRPLELDAALLPKKRKSVRDNLNDSEIFGQTSDNGAKMNPGQSELLQFSKDPFKWNDWQGEIPRAGAEEDGEPTQYGTSLIRRGRRSKGMTNVKPRSFQKATDEVNYLRMIFDGHYQLPKVLEEERENQLKMLRNDAEPQLKTSIVDLTKRIRDILLEKTGTRRLKEDDDLVILRERKINSLDKKRGEYEQRRLKFNRPLLHMDSEFRMYRKLLEERKHILDKVKEKKELGKQRNLVPQLKSEEIAFVQRTLARKDNAVLSNKGNLEVTVRDFKTLTPRRWLNDTIIEFFMKEIEASNKKVVAFNSFFYTTLSERGYQGVRRWMKKKKVQISDLDKVFVPINLNQSHWALGMIDITKKRIVYVDSLSNGPNAVSFAILSDLRDYVINESKNTLGSDFELENIECPQQPNGFDCGIYLCMNTLYLSQDTSLTFTQNDAVRMRIYIAHLVLNK